MNKIKIKITSDASLLTGACISPEVAVQLTGKVRFATAHGGGTFHGVNQWVTLIPTAKFTTTVNARNTPWNIPPDAYRIVRTAKKAGVK